MPHHLLPDLQMQRYVATEKLHKTEIKTEITKSQEETTKQNINIAFKETFFFQMLEED